MIIGFTGDLVLQEIEKTPSEIFGDFKKYLDLNEINLCVNLESPFITNDMKKVKTKIALYAYQEQFNYINLLDPFLINLGNNHVNDYGNPSSNLTIGMMINHNQSYFGVGLKDEKRNVYVDSINKHIYISFCTRSSDFSGSRLFAEKNFIGPYDIDYDQIFYIKKKYVEFKIIVNIHWGMEDIKYPEPEKRDIAYRIIDSGADLIIGHHAHIIQPFEIYKNCYIFYSLGNFYFNDIKFELNGEIKCKHSKKHQKFGIVPIFDENLRNIDILKVEIVSDLSLNFSTNYKLNRLTIDIRSYRKLHSFFYFLYRFIRRCIFACNNLDYVLMRISNINSK